MFCFKTGLFSFLWLSIFAPFAISADVESARAPHVEVAWIAPQSFGAEPTEIGVYFELEPHWHVYWKNPGDSGTAPKFGLSAEGAALGLVQWPNPVRLPLGTLVNFGYENAVVFPFRVTPQGDSVRVEAKLEWLVCKEECVPGFATLSFRRPVKGATAVWPGSERRLLMKTVQSLPKPVADSIWRVTRAEQLDHELNVDFARRGKWDGIPDVFPVDGNYLLPTLPAVRKTLDGFRATFRVMAGRKSAATGGFLVVENDRSYDVASTDVTLTSAPPPPAPDAALPSTEHSAYWVLLLSAILGGLILNLMPCVFPVLSIKVLSLAKGSRKASHIKEGLLYFAGVLVTFAALGAVLLALRAAGSSIGWGFQLQYPAIVLALAALFWMMALNFLGVFEFGNGLMNWAGRLNASGSSFGTGMLSVFVAAPCTGPFMGSALGASTVLPAWQGMGIFLGLGIGLGAPVLILSASPALLARLPRPGAWMEKLKQVLAFPLFATVLWLLWVLGHQIGERGWVLGSALLLSLSFCLWLGRGHGRAFRTLATALAVVIASASLWGIAQVPPAAGQPSRDVAQTNWVSFDPEQVAKLRAAKKPVFIDFTAAWCISCQWNKKSVLDTPAAAKLFRDHHVTTIEADWTHEDPRVTKALAEFGRNSVPLYVYYAPDSAQPQILPQLLTLSMIEDLFKPKP